MVNLRTSITILSIAFILYSIIGNFDKITHNAFYSVRYIYIFLGFMLSWLSLFFNAIAWKLIVNWLGYREKRINLIKLFLSTNIMKYMPGGIWHFIERFRVLKIEMSNEKAFLSVLLEPFIMVAAALILVPLGGINKGLSLLCFLPAVFLFKGLRLSLINQLRKIKLSQFKKIDNQFSINTFAVNSEIINESNYPLNALIAEIVFVLFRFSGFWFCLKAINIESSSSFFSWISVFSLAWVMGLLVPSAPGGVGIFEAFVLLILGKDIPEAPIILALIYYRLIVSIADIFAAMSIPGYRIFFKE